MPQNNLEVRQIQIANDILMPEIIRLIDEGHTVTIMLKGYSMRPFLEDQRDKALLTKPKDISKGDVVLAEIRPKQYVLHRIISIKGNQVTLRGDGNLGIETCRKDDVKAFALGFFRKGREKIEKTNSIKWLAYSWVWTHLFPFRRILLAIYRRII